MPAKKERSLRVNCTERQYELWEQIAEMRNVSMPEFARNCMDSFTSAYVKSQHLRYDPMSKRLIREWEKGGNVLK